MPTITEQMRMAGARVIDDLYGEVDSEYLAAAVFEAMFNAQTV